MSIAKITGSGLIGIGLSVAALWGCFVAERLTVQHAQRETARVIRQIRQLQKVRNAPVPASMPAAKPHSERPAAG